MALIPVPFEKFEITCESSPDQVVETLRREVARSDLWCWECEDRYHLEMKRKFDASFRRIKPIIDLRIHPEPPGSIIEVHIQFGPLNSMSFYGLLSVGVLTVLYAFWSVLFHGADFVICVIASLFVVAWYIFGVASFQMDADFVKTFLLELFSHSRQTQSH